jgi:hypothetical protein
MILVSNDSVVDDIDVLVLKVLGVYAVCGVKSLMSSIISSTSFFFAARAAIKVATRCLLNDKLLLRITNVPFFPLPIEHFIILEVLVISFLTFLNLKMYFDRVIVHGLLVTLA